MNYYEELGISQEATEQEIRKAHRRLVKLMHPDAQPDQSMKMLAETQMRRLNSIVATLLDASQRRSYDDQLRLAEIHPRQGAAGSLSWRGVPWWMASATGAVVLTLLAVWLWADHMGSTFGRRQGTTLVVQRSGEMPGQPANSERHSEAPKGNQVSSPPFTAPVSVPASPVPSQPASTGGISASVVNEAADPPKVTKRDLPQPVPPTKAAVSLPRTLPKNDAASKKPRAEMAKREPPQTLPPAKRKSPPQQVRVTEAKKPESKVAPPQTPRVERSNRRNPEQRLLLARNVAPSQLPIPVMKPQEVEPSRRVFSIPSSALIAKAEGQSKAPTPLPPAPRLSTQPSHDDSAASLPVGSLPTALPPKPATVTTSAAAGSPTPLMSPRDPLEGEWVYAPKEPERHKTGFYPPEFIDLRLFGSGDPGNLRGHYKAKYVVTDRPVTPEVSFELASASKGSHRFNWSSSSGAKGTLSIDRLDEQTIRIDWHTTSAVRGPTLTSGQATLVRRQ